MKVEIIPCLSDNFSYLIHDKESDKVSIVDPADYSTCDDVIKKYKKLDFILRSTRLCYNMVQILRHPRNLSLIKVQLSHITFILHIIIYLHKISRHNVVLIY